MAAAKIAILGAGLAGISAARALIARGHAVTIFDKGRGPGGRLATRRMEAAGRKLQFDHGAQYLRAEGAGFAAALVEAKAAPWPDATRRVGMPSMSAVPRALLGEIPCVASRHVGQITGRAGAWVLRHWDARLVRPGKPLPDDWRKTSPIVCGSSGVSKTKRPKPVNKLRDDSFQKGSFSPTRSG